MDEAPNTNFHLQPHNPDLQPARNDQTHVSFVELFRYADCADYILITAGTIASCSMGALFPAFAFLTGNMIDSFDDNQNILDESRRNLYLYIGLGGVALVLGLVMYYSWTIVGQRQAIKCRKQYFRSLLKQQIAWFDLQNQAAISTDFENDSMTFQMAVGEKISTILMVISMLITGIGLSLYIGWILTLVMLAYIPVVMLLWSKNIAIKVEVERQQDEVFRQSDSKAQETLGAIKLVKQMNAEQFQCSIQEKILEKVSQVYSSTINRFSASSALAVLALGLTFPLIFWYGSQCVFGTSLCPPHLSPQTYTAGSIAKILYALLLPAISLNQLAPCLEKIAEGKEAANRIFKMIDRVPLIQSKPDAIIPTQFRGQIQFVNVCFAYPKYKQKTILNDLNMKIDCRHAALAGASGCGKSTIFQLIMRFYDPDQGSIYLDGTNLKDLNLQWLRSQIGYITQQPVLFATSIRENILLGKVDASEEDIQRALKAAEAYEFVNILKRKADTFVGSGGSQLSGGQKQRIAIARALIKGSKLLLMDEATSALDRKNEARILRNLRQMQENFRSISITHRKRVLGESQKVYKFQNGRIKKITHNKKSISAQKNKNSNFLSIPGSPTRQQQTQFQSIYPTAVDPEQMDKKSQAVIENQQQDKQKQQQQKKQAQIEDPRYSISRLFTYFKQDKCLLLLGSVCAIIDGFCFPSFGIILAKIIVEQIYFVQIPNYDTSQVRTWYLIAVGIAFADATFNTLANHLFGLLSKKTVQTIRRQAFNKVIKMPIGWFEYQLNNPQKITSEITTNCKAIYTFSKNFFSHLIFVSVNILFSLISSVAFEWRTGLTSIAIIPLIIVSQGIQLGFVQGLTESKNKIYSDSVRTIQQSVMNIRTVLSLSATESKTSKYSNQLQEVIQTIKGKALLSGFMYGLGSLLQFVSFALIFFLATVYINNFNLSINGPLEAIFLIVFAGVTAGNNSNFMPDISKAKAASKKIFLLIDMEDQFEARVKAGSKRFTFPIVGNIEFKDVSFKYESRSQMALDDFNLAIRAGENVGIVGSSGCGKSTLFNLLQGFYTPTKGKILLQGIDINDYDLHHLRSSFGVVSQQPMLFNESIAWNIRYNLKDISIDELIWAAKSANYYPQHQKNTQPANITPQNESISFVRKDKYQAQHFDKNVGPRGSHVSGGQKQRIAIARAILRHPKILLLDEATSALDPESEQVVQKSLNKLMKGKTTLGITHRLEQVQHLSRIVVVKDGKVAEEGPFEEVSALQNGYFYCMLRESALRDSKQ